MSADGRHAAEPRDLTWDEAFALAHDRDQLVGRIREHEGQARYDLRHEYLGGWRPWLRWHWEVVDEAAKPGEAKYVADGFAWTKRHSYRRRHRAYLRVLDERAASDLRARRNVVRGCAICAAIEGDEHLDWCHRDGVMGGAS